MRLTEKELIRELREERPEVDSEFGRKLDQWAAAGFPRGEGPRPAPGRPGAAQRIARSIEGVRQRIADARPRRLIAPVGAAATLVVVAGIAISQSGGGPEPTVGPADQEPLQDLSIEDASPPAVGGAEGGAIAPDAARESDFLDSASSGGSGGDVAEQRNRGDAEIARDARLVLGTEADGVQEVANGVNEVTDRHRGYVVNSNVESGDGSISPGAHFRLRIPATNLQAALADLSELADVKSRNEGTRDITGRVLSAENQIERLEKALTAAERELAGAEGAERRALEQEIDALESELTAQERSLAEAEQRVDLVPVDVEIVTDAGDGGWGIEEALEDAGDALSTIGGGLLVAGAVLAPFLLIGGIAYAINRCRIRGARDRALD